MTFLINKRTQALLLLCIACIFWYAYLPQSTTSFIKDVYSNCAFKAPSSWRPGPYPTAIPYCPGHKASKYKELVAHLQTQAPLFPDHGILTAPEFGAEVRLIWIPSLQTALFNPEMEDFVGEVGICLHDPGDGEIVQVLRPIHIKVRFIDAHNTQSTLEFDGELSCLVQAAIESFIGMQPVFAKIVN